MSTIPRTHRTWADRFSPIKLMCGIALLIVAGDPRPSRSQEPEEAESPDSVRKSYADERSYDGVKVTSTKVSLDLTERFSKDLEFSERLRRVDGFDDAVISVDSLDTKKLRVRGLRQGVTTMVITGESQKKYFVEVYVGGDARLLQSVLRKNFKDSAIECEALNGGAVLLKGYVTDNQRIQQIMEIARNYAPEVINQMTVGGPQEVQTRVKIMEVQRSKLRTFGINLAALTQSAVLASSPGSITPISNLISPIGGNPSVTPNITTANPLSLAIGVSGNHFAFNLFAQALKEEGLLKVMSEPVLVARSGEAARLSDGGEFPIPVPGGLGTVTIEFREFGVILQALPIVISPTRVKLQVTAEVSDKDVSNAITLNGTTVPGLTKRKVESTVDMNFGDTMVVAGLISTREIASNLKTSLLGEIPGLGALFSKKVNNVSEIELIILLTPEYGSSMQPCQIPPGGPGFFTTTPNDRELYRDGLIEVPKYGPNCPSNHCEPNWQNRYQGDGLPGNSLDPTLPVIQPQPAMGGQGTTSTSGGLISPSGMGSSPTIPPSPNADNGMSRKLSSTETTPSRTRANTTSKTKEKEANERSSILPAGFRKGTKPTRTPTNNTANGSGEERE